MFVIISSLIPNMAPTAKTPAAMLKTASSVRVLLCQRSNQILYQITPISGVRFPFLYVLLLVRVGSLMQRLESDFGLAQELIELIVAETQQIHGASLAGPNGCPAPFLMKELHLPEVLAGAEFQRDHVRLIVPRQDDFHRALLDDVEAVDVLAFGDDHLAGGVVHGLEPVRSGEQLIERQCGQGLCHVLVDDLTVRDQGSAM